MYKDNGQRVDHRKIYGKGWHDGLRQGKKEGREENEGSGFGIGALIGGVLVGLGGLLIRALSDGSRSEQVTPTYPQKQRRVAYDFDDMDDDFDDDFDDDDDDVDYEDFDE